MDCRIFSVMSMMKYLALGLIFLAVFLVDADAGEFRDALGRRVELSETPKRIISLVPAVTEILFALDLAEHMVAVTDYCTFPAAAKTLPKVGAYADPGLENILLLQPDLIIAAADMNRPGLVRQLELLNIPVYVVYPQSVEQALQTIRALGELTDRADRAEALAGRIEDRLDKLQRQLLSSRRPQILAPIMLRPLTVAGPETFVADIIHLAGGRNLVTGGPSRYPTWNAEALLAADPEIIVVSSHPGQPDANAFFSLWPQLQAVKSGRIISINADWLHRPGPRMILGIEALARALHPELNLDE